MAHQAARKGDRHVCPKTTDEPHLKGPITEGAANVYIHGKRAARQFDSASCEGSDLFTDYVLLGRDDVLIEGRPAAREYDPTFHGGMITSGYWRVLIGASSPFDVVAVAIARIAASPYGRTEEGRRKIEKLKELHAQGKISVTGPSKDGGWGESSPETDNIVVNASDREDVDHVASVLVHEATHVENNERQRDGEFMDPMDEERSAWDAHLRYHESSGKQGAAGEAQLEDALEKYKNSNDRESYLRNSYDEDYWKTNEEFWEKQHERRGHHR